MNLSAYESALETSASYILQKSGLLKITGEDRLEFFQRQTSNDVGLLKSGKALLTVLTSPTARILDVLYLYQDAESIYALTLPRQAAETANFLKSRIFFMDQVTVEDESESTAQIDLLGPEVRILFWNA